MRVPAVWTLPAGLVLVVASVFASPEPPMEPPASMAPAPPGLRLGEAVRPEQVHLQLRIDPDEETFSGVVELQVQVADPTGIVWLNARDLAVSGAEVTVGGESREVEILEGDDDHVGLRLSAPLEKGGATLRLTYSGLLRKDETAGLFRRRVGDDWYVFSQMEPQDARRVFPGFDEPGFKVPFEASVSVPPGQEAFFNTPEVSRETSDDGWTTVRFAPSKPLPTYLVAFGVGPFDVVDAGMAGRRPTKIRILVPRGKSGDADWAVAATGPILALLEDYFDMPYPYEKLDQLAIPQVGFAMEHPGLVTYAQGLLLSAPGDDSIARRRRYASVCAHELAHMWFGDLVTMAWWDDTWLNESFATWMSAKIVDEWKPEWEWMVQQTAARERAMAADSLGSARQIRQPVTSDDDVANAFDGITYAKGRAVLWMFESWIGEEAMRTGVRSYLRKHAHGNATAGDFLSELGKASDPKITAAFLTFIEQNGVPRIDTGLSCPTDGPPRLRLSQSRYVPAGASEGAGDAASQRWQIPVCVRYGDLSATHRQCMLLSQPSAVMSLEGPACPDWVLPNAGSAGYYHVGYDTGMLDSLLVDGGSHLTKAEQVGVTQDMEAMVAAGDILEGDAMARVPDMMALHDRHVVAILVDMAAGVREMVPEDLEPAYQRYIRETFGPEARRLGWSPTAEEEEETTLLRPTLLRLVGQDGHDPDVVAEAKALAGRWLADRGAIDPLMVDTALRIAARDGDEKLWATFLEQARAHPEESERDHLFGAMGAFTRPEIVRKNLALILSGEFEFFEVAGLLSGAMAEPAGRELVWEWGRENYAVLLERVPRGFQSGIIRLGGRFCDDPHIDQVETFFRPRVGDMEGGPRTLDQTLERMRVCVARKTTQQPSVADFLAQWATP